MYDVIIIGGGLSGLAAAVKLSLMGMRVALFEKSPMLGGRCYSYIDKKTGDIVDNGQHVLLGAYHNLLEYLEIIGTEHLLKREPLLSLPFYHPQRGRAIFQVSSLPKPFHLTAGMLKFKLLSFKDRRHLLKVGLELSSASGGWSDELEEKLSSLTIDQWLDSLSQSSETKKTLWYPIAISVMNERPEKASALLFARSLRAAFLGKKSDSAVLIPTVGQTELYVEQAEKLFNRNHGKIFLNTEVDSIEVYGDKVASIRLKDGSKYKAMDNFESSPIVSFHLWFDKNFMDVDYIGLIDRHLQWIFDRRTIMKEDKPTGFISAVISGAFEDIDLTKEKLIALALREIREVFPESRETKLIHSVIIKEKRATFSATNEIEKFRPPSETSIRNFYLAGDWTNTGLPATIEGAVMSGFRAADLLK
ncbi:MAG: FAD-dependent oxidoreductase [Ignavibacteriales bacterium]|nr:FAD-dependent oxidoreductase [Ignavibacteriales bacterium]